MPPQVAALVFCVGILGLFWLDRDSRSHPSGGLWIAWAWFLLACSRPVSAWLNLGEIQRESVSSASELLSEGSPVDRAVYTALLVLGLLVLARRRDLTIKSVRSCLPVALFLGYCLLSLLWSDFPSIAFKRWTKLLGDWVMVMIVWTDPDPLAALKRLITRTAFIVIPVSILFIKYFGDIGRWFDYLGQVYYSGVTREKNTLGSLCVLFGLAAVWALIGLWRDKGKGRLPKFIAQGTVLAMVTWLLSILDAQTSLSAFVLALSVLVASSLKSIKRSRVAIHCLTVVVILVPVLVTILGVGTGALHALGRNPTLTGRTEIWEGVIRITPNRWLGSGFESFWLGPRVDRVVSEVTLYWVPNQAHSGYVETYANLGWVGIVGLGAVLCWGYRRIIRTWRNNHPAGSLMLAWFTVAVIFNLTEAAFFRIMIPVWLFFLIAITVPPRLRKRSSPTEAPRLKQRGQAPEQVTSEICTTTRMGEGPDQISLPQPAW